MFNLADRHTRGSTRIDDFEMVVKFIQSLQQKSTASLAKLLGLTKGNGWHPALAG